MGSRTTANWQQTYTGRAFWPLTPRVEDFDIRDVARHLACKCRYGGATSDFYSVAQHSVLVSHYVAEECRPWALMHDVGEAYLPDVQRPIKRYLPGFQEVEQRIQKEAAKWLGLIWPIPAEVHRVDDAIIAAEQAALFGPPPLSWPEVIPGREVTIVIGQPLLPDQAEELFLARFAELFGGLTRWHGSDSPDYTSGIGTASPSAGTASES